MITVAYITARPNCEFSWFFDSLRRNHRVEEIGQIIIVDRFAEACDDWTEDDVRRASVHVMDCAKGFASITQHVAPKPCVWSGKHRLTPRNWWSKSSYSNTALCLCRHDFIAFLDDRCVLAPTWLDAVLEARDNQYVVAGTYSKRSGMMVRDGVITNEGTVTGSDSRMEGESDPNRRRPIPGDRLFGCTYALPIEFMLNVNGISELTDSVSMEDVIFGLMVQNNGYKIYHDGRMKMIEDRTPEEQDARNRAHDMKRSSKEKHPHDKSDKCHTLLRTEAILQRSTHQWDLRKIRESVLAGNPFPIPATPTHDPFDNQPLKEMI